MPPDLNTLELGTSRILLILIATLANSSALAEERLEDDSNESINYVLGLATSMSPRYAGSAQRDFKLRPLWALQYGRLRISTSKAGSFMSESGEPVSPGASADLIQRNRFKIGAGLRIDGGRSVEDDSSLAGLPQIRRTLRARVYASYAVTEQWTLSAGFTQDILGRAGGATASIDAGYRARLNSDTELLAGAGAAFGSTQYMRSYFGIPQTSSLQTGLPLYQPSAGIYDLHTVVGLTKRLSENWIIYGELNLSRLMGKAAHSPLTKNTNNLGGSIGLAYRCCK
ncbi:MAG: MipA/OmpV family protein [Burkholderiaceae bacterium]|nr:MipA/OmpV family protein [Burkholderiaceae bacterium]